MNADNQKESVLTDVASCIIEAGKAILEVYETDFSVDLKDDKSPITEADRRAHTIIKDSLEGLSHNGYSKLPFLSEEGIHTEYSERSGWNRYWLVDPLDGTKEFVNRNGEFTCNIALVEDGVPAAGWVYVPVTDVLYVGVYGTGAFRIQHASKHKTDITDSQTVSLPDPKADHGGKPAVRSEFLRIVASRSHLNGETAEYIETIQKRTGKKAETLQAGSSLKLCRIAEGSADLYPRFGPTMEWDTAAAHAVCRAAGCSVIDVNTRAEMIYNKQDLHNPCFIAAPTGEIQFYLP